MQIYKKNSITDIFQKIWPQVQSRDVEKYILTEQTFQRCFDVGFRLIWRRDVVQRQINVVYFNVDLNNVRQSCHFQRRIIQS